MMNPTPFPGSGSGGGGVDPALEGRVNAVLQQRILSSFVTIPGSVPVDPDASVESIGIAVGDTIELYLFDGATLQGSPAATVEYEYTGSAPTVQHMLDEMMFTFNPVFSPYGVETYAFISEQGYVELAFGFTPTSSTLQRVVSIPDLNPISEALGFAPYEQALLTYAEREGLSSTDVEHSGQALAPILYELRRQVKAAMRATVSGTPVPSGTPVRERILLAPFVEFSSSETWEKDFVLSEMQAEAPGVTAEDVEMLILTVSGASGGNVGTGVTGYGGYPGLVNWIEVRMSDLPDTVAVTIGAGGVSGQNGGTTSFGDIVRSLGSRCPSSGNINDSTWYNRARTMADLPDLRDQANTFSTSMPMSKLGPGGGGSVGSGRFPNGGSGGARYEDTSTSGGSGSDAGQNAVAGKFWSFGAGGGGDGGAGGFPGGGGGAKGSGTAGTGGNGCVRILYRIREIA